MNTHETLMNFIKVHGDKRITKDAFAYYKNPDNLVLGGFEYGEEGLIGVSLSGLLENQIVFSITVVHKDYRNRGIGTKLLRAKIAQIERQGLTYSTVVAEDNQPSLRICEKAEMKRSGESVGVRKSGKYLRILLNK